MAQVTAPADAGAKDNHGYAAGIHRDLPPRLCRPGQEFPARDEGRVRAANQPASTGFELALLQEA